MHLLGLSFPTCCSSIVPGKQLCPPPQGVRRLEQSSAMTCGTPRASAGWNVCPCCLRWSGRFEGHRCALCLPCVLAARHHPRLQQVGNVAAGLYRRRIRSCTSSPGSWQCWGGRAFIHDRGGRLLSVRSLTCLTSRCHRTIPEPLPGTRQGTLPQPPMQQCWYRLTSLERGIHQPHILLLWWQLGSPCVLGSPGLHRTGYPGCVWDGARQAGRPLGV